MKAFYDLEAKTLQGQNLSMHSFAEKTILIVNTASKCGLTLQYEGLEALYQKYENKGLVILGFPCNQFGEQEPGSEASIEQGCILQYGVTFPMFAKVEVNGDQAHPIYKWLKEALPGDNGVDIEWNFEKFLVSKTGKAIQHFTSGTQPEEIGVFCQKIL